MNTSKMLASRARQISERREFHPKDDGVVPSPCVSVCTMTEDRSHCQGCFRTLEDLRAWSGADAAARRAIWARALARARVALPAELAQEPA